MDWFWLESIWCPPTIKWTDFAKDSASFRDLNYSFVTAAALILLRTICEHYVFLPIGKALCNNSSSTITSRTNNGTNRNHSVANPAQHPEKTSQKTSGDTRTSRVRKPTTSHKFSEGLWRFTFYLFASIYGWFYVLGDKPHLTDTNQLLYNYHLHPVKSEEWWYYNIELGFYISLLVTQFMDTKRSDFWQMFVHHIVTITLLVLSWACNFHRIGALVLAIHDVADVPMEGAKLAKYCKKQRLADLLFAIFTITWIYTRCYLLPTRVIYYTSYKALSIIPFFPAYYIFNGLLCLLQLLHIAWTYLIIRIVFDALQNDGMRDLRSDSETEEDLHKD